MRLLTWAVLVALAVTGLVVGRPELGFALAGAKALAVGLEFMELKHAARLHAGVFVFGVVAMVGLLVGLVG
jgi:hypothetical protein